MYEIILVYFYTNHKDPYFNDLLKILNKFELKINFQTMKINKINKKKCFYIKKEIEIEKEIIIKTTKEKMKQLFYVIQYPFYIKQCTNLDKNINII